MHLLWTLCLVARTGSYFLSLSDIITVNYCREIINLINCATYDCNDDSRTCNSPLSFSCASQLLLLLRWNRFACCTFKSGSFSSRVGVLLKNIYLQGHRNKDAYRIFKQKKKRNWNWNIVFTQQKEREGESHKFR